MSALLLCTSVLAMAPPMPALPRYEAGEAVGTLWSANPRQTTPELYVPQEGDILFMSQTSLLYSFVYPLVRSFHPWHSLLIVRRATGELAVMESGGDGIKCTTLRDIRERLASELKTKKLQRVWVRRVKAPLTRNESRWLTAFAESALSRPFSSDFRLARLAVPGRILPFTTPDQDNFFCSEILVQSLISSGLISPGRIRPQSITPYDLMHDKRIDISARWAAVQIYSPDHNPPPPGPILAKP